jgi:hypothetical protein
MVSPELAEELGIVSPELPELVSPELAVPGTRQELGMVSPELPGTPAS